MTKKARTQKHAQNNTKTLRTSRRKRHFCVFGFFFLFIIFFKLMLSPRNVELPPWYGQYFYWGFQPVLSYSKPHSFSTFYGDDMMVCSNNLSIKLMKGKALRKHSLHEQTAASVLLKPFISSNEWCHTTDAPSAWAELHVKCEQHTCTLHDPWGPDFYDYTMM